VEPVSVVIHVAQNKTNNTSGFNIHTPQRRWESQSDGRWFAGSETKLWPWQMCMNCVVSVIRWWS